MATRPAWSPQQPAEAFTWDVFVLGGDPASDAADRLVKFPTKEVEREFLLAFWKIHILHHAAEEPVVGQWIIRELRRHGYEVSPGTLYPLLARMEARGWLRSKSDPGGGLRARKDYSLTREGRSVLELLRRHVEELHREVVRALDGGS